MAFWVVRSGTLMKFYFHANRLKTKRVSSHHLQRIIWFIFNKNSHSENMFVDITYMYMVYFTSYNINKLNNTWNPLYTTKTSLSLNGFLLAITLGPNISTIYRYATIIISVGIGLCIRGHSDVRGSENYYYYQHGILFK